MDQVLGGNGIGCDSTANILTPFPSPIQWQESMQMCNYKVAVAGPSRSSHGCLPPGKGAIVPLSRGDHCNCHPNNRMQQFLFWYCCINKG